MSLSPTQEGAAATLPRRGHLLARLAVVAAALIIVGGALGILGLLLDATLTPPPPPRNPFGTGLMEAAPSASGFGGFILAVQSQFYRVLTSTLEGMKRDGTALWALLGIGLAYGVFHAVGPGHGKGVISGYIVASERSLKRGLALSFAAAILQALVAIALVAALAIALRATAAAINATAHWVELASFAAVFLFGLGLTWRKAGKFLAMAGPASARFEAPGCDHVHLPPPAEIERLEDWKQMAGVVVAAGIRPCSGAIIVLVFALSQGLWAAGVAATLAMSLGTAVTTGALAAMAVFMKSLALRLAQGRGRGGAVAVAWLEVLAAAFVVVLGAALLAGLWTSSLPS